MCKSTKKIFFPLIFVLSVLLVFCLTSCAGKPVSQPLKWSRTDFMLDTVVSVTVYDETQVPAVDACLEEIARYEKIFSRTDSSGELYALNAAGGGQLSPEMEDILSIALEYCSLTDGRFDITMGGVSSLYSFSAEEPAVPSVEDLREALSHTGWDKLRLEDGKLGMDDPEAVIDLGAIAKGYIADRLAGLLQSEGVESAIIDLGGNIYCVGAKPDGSDYRVGIQYPSRGSARAIAYARLQDKSVVTSGVYQRSFEDENGRLWHHLLDSDSGLPVENGLVSVSVIGPSSAVCDALSTGLFALGLDEGMELIDSLDGYCALFITEDMKLHYSSGCGELFEAAAN